MAATYSLTLIHEDPNNGSRWATGTDAEYRTHEAAWSCGRRLVKAVRTAVDFTVNETGV